jgi:ABC-type phosphate transport system substrate-binding protein
MAIVAAAIATPAQAQAYKVIVHPDVAVSEVSTAALSNLFLKKDTRFEGGPEAVPVDLPATSPVRATFSKAVHARASAVIVQFWLQQVFSGKDTPPAIKASDDAVVAFVKSTPGGIGYVSASATADGVKVLKVK